MLPGTHYTSHLSQAKLKHRFVSCWSLFSILLSLTWIVFNGI